MFNDKLVPANHVIVEEYIETLSSFKNMSKELNLVSWDNVYESKFDIRVWNKDHDRIGKGITLTKREAIILADALQSYLNNCDSEGDFDEPIFLEENNENDDIENEYQEDPFNININSERIEELEYENNTLRLMLCKEYMTEQERFNAVKELVQIHTVLPEAPFAYEYISSFTGAFEDSDFTEIHKKICSKAREMALNDGGTDIINFTINITPIVCNNYQKSSVKYFANASGAIVRRK